MQHDEITRPLAAGVRKEVTSMRSVMNNRAAASDIQMWFGSNGLLRLTGSN
jgi:hypothetical protein